MPNGYRCIELAHAWLAKAETSMVVNHDGICLIYWSCQKFVESLYHVTKKQRYSPSTSRERVSTSSLPSSIVLAHSQPTQLFLTNLLPSSSTLQQCQHQYWSSVMSTYTLTTIAADIFIDVGSPKDFVLIISNPVNSTVPIASEVFKRHGVCDSKVHLQHDNVGHTAKFIL